MTITRRTTMKSLLAGMATMAVPGTAMSAVESVKKRIIPWKNWAGTYSCTPEIRATPKTVEELTSVIKASKGVIRAVGAGHSWSPLVPTDGTLLSLRRFNGLVDQDTKSQRVKLGAGTKLSQVGPMLDELGLAMHNLPDIDEQTLAGAFSTGTHGTGLNVAALHDAVEALTLVTANGEVMTCSRTQNAEVFDAARVSLGALGIITDYTLKTPTAFRVERKTWLEDLDTVLEKSQKLAENHRHFEFFYVPFSGYSWCFTTDVTDKAITGLQEEGLNELLEPVIGARDKFATNPTARRNFLRTVLESVEMPPAFVEKPWKTLATDRTIPIYEMEYQLPYEVGPQVFREVVDYIETNHPELFIPLEYRYVDADDAWLSEFYGRKSVSISVHRFREGDGPWKIYTNVQKIFLKHGGRPHWGKIHNLGYKDLQPLYPKLEEFRKIRQQLDPGGRFANAHIRHLMGLPA